MRTASLLLVVIVAGCSEKTNTKIETVESTAKPFLIVGQPSQKFVPKVENETQKVNSPPNKNEKAERRDAVKKLVEDRKAELVKAKLAAETAIARAELARDEAEKATSIEAQDLRIYLRARQLDKTNNPDLPDGIRYDKSKQAANEAVQRARKPEADKAVAVEARAEIQAALRRAEELLAQQGE